MSRDFMVLEFRLDPARTNDAPAADGLKNGEQSSRDKNQSPQRIIACDDNPGDEAERADDAARHAAAVIKIGMEETAHNRKLARAAAKAKSCPRTPSAAY